MANVERGHYKTLKPIDSQENSSEKPLDIEHKVAYPTWSSYNVYHLFVAFFLGIVACAVTQHIIVPLCGSSNSRAHNTHQAHLLAASSAGSTQVDTYPPTSPTNVFPSLFPTPSGYSGPTPTGAQPGIVATAPRYPVHTGAPLLVGPVSLEGERDATGASFDIFKHWGNLSPWYSVGRAFGLDSSPEAPETCKITGLHVVHRHGARYPGSYVQYGEPGALAGRLHDAAANWTASGKLAFLNEWTYKLGQEILTPFGRHQLYDLGVSLRLKYGYLLSDFTKSNTIPVFRTESQDRMLASAMNFAIGFFGWPVKDQYQQSIVYSARGINHTLAPYMTCNNARVPERGNRSLWYLERWTKIYLRHALKRLQAQLKGYTLTIRDLYTFQEICTFETAALGYSKFCELFTREEWEGFEYAMELVFWYDSAFGSPLARVQGIGYINELIARLTHTPIATHNTSTNATLDNNPITFPLHNSLYVDATHEIVAANIITALNLTSLARSGPLPYDHIPKNRSFVASQIVPYATNILFQLLSCSSIPDPQIRIILNDGVVPLTGIKGCPEQKDGMCPVSNFVSAQKQISWEADWAWGCYGQWDIPPGTNWTTTTGDPPKRP